MKENIDFVNDTIKFIAQKLNDKKINFYIVGAIGAYIDANLPLQRRHDDLDLMIEEKDIDRVKKIFDNTEFNFYDNRLTSNKVLNQYGYPQGDHEVYAQHKNIDFHIGFFLYHYDEKTYTISEYFKNGNKQMKLERSLPINIFDYQYNNTTINYLGVNLKVARKELIYKNKKVMGREKDLFDANNLEPTIDTNIINKLKGLSNIRQTKIIEI